MSFWAIPEILATLAAAQAGDADLPTPLKYSKKDVSVGIERELNAHLGHKWSADPLKHAVEGKT